MRVACSLFVALAAFGCAAPSPPPPTPPAPSASAPEPAPTPAPMPTETAAPAPVPSAEPAPVPAPQALAALPPALSCKQGAGAKVKSLRKDGSPPPVAGQMTEEAAQAKRLFDRESWADALTAMTRVSSGETGDDTGNRQLAEYHRAIALYRLGRAKDSYAVFRSIATTRNHLKRLETLLWIVKLSRDHAELVALADLAAYDVADAKRFDNAQQSEVFAVAAYLIGRERVAEGDKAEARALLGAVPEAHPWSKDAKACLELVR